jgi:hypothetical protein
LAHVYAEHTPDDKAASLPWQFKVPGSKFNAVSELFCEAECGAISF